MKRIITLATAVLYLGVVAPGILSQQPTHAPKQNDQAAKAPVSADVPAEIQSARENCRVRDSEVTRTAGVSWCREWDLTPHRPFGPAVKSQVRLF